MSNALTKRDINFILLARYESPEFELDKVFRPNHNYFEIKPRGSKGLKTMTSTISTFLVLLKVRKRIDLIHTIQYFPMSAISAFIGKITGKPVITTIFAKYPKSGNPISELFNRISEKLVFELSDEIAFECQMTKNAFKSKKGVVVLNGIDVSYFSPNPKVRSVTRKRLGIDQDEIAILFLSRITKSKGIFELVEAIGRLKHTLNRRIKVVLVGSIEDDKVFGRIRELGLDDIIVNVGPVGRMDVYDYYCAGDIYVLPSYIEGISSSLIEAMACGLPPISTSVGGNLEVVKDGENGLLVKPRDLKSLAAKLHYLITNDAIRTELGRNARLSIERDFSIDRMVNEFIGLYRKQTITGSP
jgi:N,N'-diacetylbacillosaminyl-diphospho-undecaprenol alpha-1,3-N-acetylgalactosaminyltransferase